MYDYDLFVIGAGSGGVASSRRAAPYGARAAICENSRVGGTCVIRGCIPKKLFVYGAHVSEEIRDAANFGWTIRDARFDWPTLVANTAKEVDRLNGIYENMLRDAGVELIRGSGRLVDPHTVEVDGHRATAERILIASGARPALPDVPGIEHAITSDDVFTLERKPERMVIVGGGYIAVEFACVFNALGTQVTEVIRGDNVLRGFDRDIRLHLESEMEREGIDIRRRTQVSEIVRHIDCLLVNCVDGSHIEADVVMYATGRIPNTENLGLAEAGVEMRRNGAVVVDEWSRSSVENIYAVGDCTDRKNLTPVAIAEGRALVETLYNDNPMTIDYDHVPSAVFSQPPVGSVGLPEEEARSRYGDISLFRSTFRPLKNTVSGNPGRTMMKLVVDKASDRVVGAHMVGPDAPEIVQMVAIAMNFGATKAQFDATIGAHPTAGEEFMIMYKPFEPIE